MISREVEDLVVGLGPVGDVAALTLTPAMVHTTVIDAQGGGTKGLRAAAPRVPARPNRPLRKERLQHAPARRANLLDPSLFTRLRDAQALL